MSFADFDLEDRLLQAISQQGLTEPTPIQEKGIPLALQDKKDIVAKAKTGSGKTLAYLIPILDGLLKHKKNSTTCIILVPSKELADQLVKVLATFCIYAARDISYVNIAQPVADKVRKSLLSSSPNIVIATPAVAHTQIESGDLKVKDLEYLVLDEADLFMTYGFQEDLEYLHQHLPKHIQTWLMSATLSEDVDQLKAWFCRMPVTLRLEDNSKDELMQYFVECSEIDKFLLAYVIFKLHLIKGKTLIFVDDVDRCYRLKLFFEQFGIRSCALNSEMPVASRLHIVEAFNRNVYNIVIATDDAKTATADVAATKKSNSTNDTEFGVSRGIDFKNVACVLNFDLPISSKVYTHRIGRTARANKTGMALSFVVPKSEYGKHKIATTPSGRKNEKSLAKIMHSQSLLGNELKPYKFDMKQVENFRYRMEDAFRAVTRTAVREARIKELKNELLTSDKLQRHFEENPEDLAALRHDKVLHPSRVQSELKRVPEYLLPVSAKVTKPIFIQDNARRNLRRGPHKRDKRKSSKKKGKDPLKSFGR